jgi:hypothetical protein
VSAGGQEVAKIGNLPRTPILDGEAKVAAKLAYIEHLMESRTVSQALEATGITLYHLRRFRAEDPEFCLREEEVKLFEDDLLRRTITEMVLDKDRSIVTAAMKRLPEYNPAKQTEVKVSGSVEHKHLKDMSLDDKRALIQEAAAIDADFEEIT